MTLKLPIATTEIKAYIKFPAYVYGIIHYNTIYYK